MAVGSNPTVLASHFLLRRVRLRRTAPRKNLGKNCRTLPAVASGRTALASLARMPFIIPHKAGFLTGPGPLMRTARAATNSTGGFVALRSTARETARKPGRPRSLLPGASGATTGSEERSGDAMGRGEAGSPDRQAGVSEQRGSRSPPPVRASGRSTSVVRCWPTVDFYS